jgi:hypothetical protein
MFKKLLERYRAYRKTKEMSIVYIANKNGELMKVTLIKISKGIGIGIINDW